MSSPNFHCRRKLPLCPLFTLFRRTSGKKPRHSEAPEWFNKFVTEFRADQDKFHEELSPTWKNLKNYYLKKQISSKPWLTCKLTVFDCFRRTLKTCLFDQYTRHIERIRGAFATMRYINRYLHLHWDICGAVGPKPFIFLNISLFSKNFFLIYGNKVLHCVYCKNLSKFETIKKIFTLPCL